MVVRTWGSRVIGGAAEVAGVLYALLGHPRGNAIVIGLVLILLGHGMVNLRSINAEKFATAMRVGSVAGAVLVLLGAVTALLSPGPGEGRPSLLGALHESLSRMVGRTISWNSATPAVRAVNDALPIASAIVVLAVLFVVVGPMRDLPEPDEVERRRIAELSGGVDSDLLAPFTTRRDKRYVFSPTAAPPSATAWRSGSGSRARGRSARRTHTPTRWPPSSNAATNAGGGRR